MGVFDIFKRRNVSESEEVKKTSEVNTEDQDKLNEDTTILWDTLSFSAGSGTDRGETPYIPQERAISKDNAPGTSEHADASFSRTSSITMNEVPFVPRKNEPIREQTTSSSTTSTTDYSNYVFPKSDLLTAPAEEERESDSVYKEKLEAVFQNYRIKAQIMTVSQTDIAITFGISPSPGVRVNSITSYKEEYRLALGGRIEFEIPLKGTSYLGLHVLKDNKSGISLKRMTETPEYMNTKARIPLLLGVSTSGSPVIEDLDSIGNLLIGGETGSGKSVFLNSLILGMLYKCSPADLRFIFVDTNIVNLNVYNGIPSLLIPVVTDPKKAVSVLSWCSQEINRRTQIMVESACKDIDDYNAKPDIVKLAHIVVVIDEFAPLIEDEDGLEVLLSLTTVGKAAGIHMVLSTQKISSRTAMRRIKECIHARISFSVFSESESKAVLDMSGAENLSGSGDMVYRKLGENSLIRIQGVNANDEDTKKTVEFIKQHNFYDLGVEQLIVEKRTSYDYADGSGYDEFLKEAGLFVIEKQKASIGTLQRICKIGFNRAAHIMDQLEDLGVVGPEEGIKPRRILMSIEEFNSVINQLNL